jgi:hypothetical protein
MKAFLSVLFLASVIGCSSVNILDGGVHTAALMLKQSRESVLSQAEHVLMQPIDIRYYFPGESDEIEARRYAFNEEYDVILLFGKGIFFALDPIKPGSNDYPRLLRDFKSIKSDDQSSLRGYIVTKISTKLKLQVLMKK